MQGSKCSSQQFDTNVCLSTCCCDPIFGTNAGDLSGLRRSLLQTGARAGGHEAIASARDVRNVPSAVQTIAEHFAKTSDVHAEICLFHDDVWPSPRDELLLTDNFAGGLYQDGQKIKRTTANRKCFLAPLQ